MINQLLRNSWIRTIERIFRYNIQLKAKISVDRQLTLVIEHWTGVNWILLTIYAGAVEGQMPEILSTIQMTRMSRSPHRGAPLTRLSLLIRHLRPHQLRGFRDLGNNFFSKVFSILWIKIYEN